MLPPIVYEPFPIGDCAKTETVKNNTNKTDDRFFI